MDKKSPIKSKTIQLNVWSPIIYGALTALGVAIPAPVVLGGLALANVVLRFFTKQPVK